MLGIYFSVDICTLHMISSKNVDLNIFAQIWHSMSVMGHKQGLELAVPVLLAFRCNVKASKRWKKYI